MLTRAIEKTIDHYLTSQSFKALYIWGPRRSGKTTLLEKLSQELGVVKFNFDFESDREKFVPRREILAKLVKENRVILIDEVQNYPEATVMLKLLHDEFKVKVIATGSSELRQKSKNFDTMAGRFTETFCLPLSSLEIADNEEIKPSERAEYENNLATYLQIFGAYPEIYTKRESLETERIDLLQNILEAYVLKDVIAIYDLKNTKLAKDILLKIALQIGSEVSLREIANSLGANVATVSNYVEVFIKNYILIPLPAFKTNARRAVSLNRKLYFYDLGLRNILVQDFRPLQLRPDKGGVFENFIISEIEKQRKIYNLKINLYFYREYGGKEIDLVIEDYKKTYTCLEIKVGLESAKKIFPLPHTLATINAKNYFKKINELCRVSLPITV